MPLYAQESFVNLTRGHRYGDSDIYETFADTPGELYRAMQREYGRCVGKAYVDLRIPTNDDGGERWETRAIGWVFVSRAQYEDTGETYLREVWITLYDAPDTVVREHHYHAI